MTQDQLDRALLEQSQSGGKLGEVLVAMGVLDNQALASELATFFGLTVVNLRRDNVDPAVIALVPEELAREQMFIPVRLEDNSLYVAVAKPTDQMRDYLQELTGHKVILMIAPPSDITWAIDSNYRAIRTSAHWCKRSRPSKSLVVEAQTNPKTKFLIDDAPVVQVVDRILTQAMRDRASDVHIEPAEEFVRIRFRIDGALKEVLQLPVSMGPGLVSRVKIMANMNIVERRRPQDGQLTITVDGKEVDVRVATVSTIMGENCVMRILDKTRSVFRLGDLGMPTDTHAQYSKLARSPFGMVLCAGPTGSGKTTTLYATLSRGKQLDSQHHDHRRPCRVRLPDDQSDPDK